MRGPLAASVVFAAICAGSVAAMLLGRALGMEVPGRALLVVASTAFVAVPLVAGGYRCAYGWLVIAGLVGCWWGDWAGQAGSFLGSVGAFAVAHVLFIAAFAVRGLAWRGAALAVPIAVGVGAGIATWLLPHVPTDLRLPVIGYMVVISTMVVAAAGVRPGPGQSLVLAAAVVFYVSDIFVARWKFVDDSGTNAFFCYPLYYAACLMFGFSVLGVSSPAPRPAPADGGPVP